MKDYEFYRLYANTPIADRGVIISVKSQMTLNEIYDCVKRADEVIRTAEGEKKRLLEIAEPALIKNK